jgi:iron(III) transport system permease protein
MLQVGTELEEAAHIQGASFARRFMKIVLPLSKSGFKSGFLLIFMGVMKELDLFILIMTPNMATLPYVAFQYTNENMTSYANVVAVMMFFIVLVVYALSNVAGKTDIAQSMGG